jgi:hypothetical protein
MLKVSLRRGPADPEEPYHALADLIAGALPAEYDGWGTDDATVFELFLYGPDADGMWGRVRPLLAGSPEAAGGSAVRRYGPPGAVERQSPTG